MDINQGADGSGAQQPLYVSPVRHNTTPLPHQVRVSDESSPVTDTVGQQHTNVTDTDRQRRTEVSDSGGHRPTPDPEMTDTVGHTVNIQENKDVGHDHDMPEPEARHTLSTYEAGKLFEEAQCRVSERTIIRWCNKNKNGKRRLDCAFDLGERKYYIAEDSVKAVIREERSKGRQTEQYQPDMADTEPVTVTDTVGQQHTNVTDTDRQRRTEVSDSGGHRPTPDPEVSDARHTETVTEPADRELQEENVRLKVELAKLETQTRTKDEMMTFLRQEIDRRGTQVKEDRETYDQALAWFRTQVEAKDRVIERLNSEMRGLLEAPKQQPTDTRSNGGADSARHIGTELQDTPEGTGNTRDVDEMGGPIHSQ